MLPEKSSEPQRFQTVNTTTLVEFIPEKPEPKACVKCGTKQEPIYLKSVHFQGRCILPARWDFLLDRGFCEPCQKQARVEQEKRRIEREREYLDQKLMDLLEPRGFMEFKFETFHPEFGQKEAFDATMDFSPGEDNLFLWGTAGSGKSHLAIAALRVAFYKGLSCDYVKHPTLNREFQGLKNDEYEQALARMVKTKMLIIDDLGVAKQTDYADQVLYEILDGRMMKYQNGLIITSNLSIKDLASRFGDDRLVSRIAGLCRPIKVSGMDYRLKTNHERKSS